jgi:hypothetical protein
MTHGTEIPDILLGLCKRLPEPGIAVPSIDRPLVLLDREEAMPVACVETHKLGLACQVVVKEAQTPDAMLRELMDAGELGSAVNYLACSLPPREALWWATRFAWDVSLDIERTNWRKIQAPPVAPPPSAKEAAAPPPPKLTMPLDEIASLTNNAFGKATAAIQAAIASPKIQAAIAADPSIAEGGANFASRFNLAAASTNTPPPPKIIPKPSGKGRVPRKPAPAPKPLEPTTMKGRIALRRRELRLWALACALQWIEDPCQEHANLAGKAAKEITGGGVAKTLATATFWSGENLNLDTRKAAVPPPVTLRPKGIRSVLSKVLTRKGGSLSRTDRLHWALHLGIRNATGVEQWDDADADFKNYCDYLQVGTLNANGRGW